MAIYKATTITSVSSCQIDFGQKADKIYESTAKISTNYVYIAASGGSAELYQIVYGGSVSTNKYMYFLKDMKPSLKNGDLVEVDGALKPITVTVVKPVITIS